MKEIKRRQLDNILDVVLVDRGHEYATYLYNKEYDSFYAGNYFGQNEEEAREDFFTRQI